MVILKNKKNRKLERGFSLMELMVAIALLVIILSVSLFSYDNFGKDVELENSAYSVALAIRETQVYGINKALKDSGGSLGVGDLFGGDYGYGVYFEKDDVGESIDGTTDADKKNFILFLDKEDDGVYDKIFDKESCGGGGECYKILSLGKGNYIDDLKYYNDTNNVWNSVNSLEFYFQRPDPEARIISNSETVLRPRGRIIIKDPSGKYQRCVEVGMLGDITINRCP